MVDYVSLHAGYILVGVDHDTSAARLRSRVRREGPCRRINAGTTSCNDPALRFDGSFRWIYHYINAARVIV
jgi:hypothetical protein